MRTKALVCAAALAASIACSMAQANVYSLNVVGYYQVTMPAGEFTLIANQLDTGNNYLSNVIPAVSLNTAIYPWSEGVWGAPAVYARVGHSGTVGSWGASGAMPMPLGACFIANDPNADTLTFVGTVLQGSLTNAQAWTPGAIQFSADQVPMAGGITSNLGVQPEINDALYTMSGGVFGAPAVYARVGHSGTVGSWGTEPQIAVGQGFGYVKSPTGVNLLWTQNFTVE